MTLKKLRQDIMGNEFNIVYTLGFIKSEMACMKVKFRSKRE